MDIATRLRAKLKLDSDESLVDMFDDILLAFNSRLQDSAYLEEQMLQMAIHFEKTRKRYESFCSLNGVHSISIISLFRRTYI